MEKIVFTIVLIAWMQAGTYLFGQAIEPIIVIIKSEDNTRDLISENNYFEQVPKVPKTRLVSYPEQPLNSEPFDLYKGQNKFIKTYEDLYSQKNGLFLSAATALLRCNDFNSTLNFRVYNRRIRESISISAKSSFIELENILKARIMKNIRLENPLIFRYSRDERFLKSHVALTESIPRVDFKQAAFIDYTFEAAPKEAGFLYENRIDKRYTPSFCFTYKPGSYNFSPAFHFTHKAVRLDTYTDFISDFTTDYMVNWDFYFQGKAADKVVFSFFKESDFFNRKHFLYYKKKVETLSGETYKTVAGADFGCSLGDFSLFLGSFFYFNNYFLAYSIGKELQLSYPDLLATLQLIYQRPKFRLEVEPYVFFKDFGYRSMGLKTHFKDIEASFVTLSPGIEASLEDFFAALRAEAVLDLLFTITDQAAMFLNSRGGIKLSELYRGPGPDYLFRFEGGITIFW